MSLLAASQQGLSDPVSGAMALLKKAGYDSFDGGNPWEACLCALVLALEPQCKIYRLIESLPYQNHPLDRTDALNIFARLGYVAHPVRLRMKEADQRLFPFLFVPQNAAPIVVLERSDNNLKLYKNARAETVPLDAAEADAEGTAWIFKRYDETRAPTSRFIRAGSGASWFRALLERFRGTFGQVLLAGLALNIIALATPLYTMLVYDRVIAAAMPDVLPMLAVGAGISILFEGLLRKMRSRGLSWLAARMDNIVGNAIFAHLTGLSPSLIERASVASQIARIKTFEAVRDFFSGSVFLSMLELPFVLIAAAAIYAIAGQLVFVPLAVTLLYAVLFYIVHRKVKVAIRLAAKASSARQQFAIETFEKIKGVRGYGLTNIWQSKFRDLSGREMVAHFHLNWLGMVAETAANALTLIAAVATVGFGVQMIWAGTMSAGTLVATMILVWRVLTPFYSLCTMIPRLEQIRNSIIQVNKLMDIDTEVMEAAGSARLPKMQGRVAMSHVTFRYVEGGEAVLPDLSFEAEAGDLVVVSGENGSGKSTILKLLKGLYKAQEGSVRIDGFDIRQLDAQDLRRQIAYVPQQPDFFNGTVIENLRIANPLAGEDDIRKALELADAWEDVSRLQNGLNAMIGKYGEGAIPVGLAMKLSLARAYLHPAPLLLIDELPNAFLSGTAGQNLKNYLIHTKGKRTTIMVTFREDFMHLSDTIILLRRGEAPIAGRRDAVLKSQNKKEAA